VRRGTEAPLPMLAVLLLIGVSQFKQHRSEAPFACSGRYRLVAVLVTPAAGLQLERVRNVLRSLASIVVNQFLEHRQAPFQRERLTLIATGAVLRPPFAVSITELQYRLITAPLFQVHSVRTDPPPGEGKCVGSMLFRRDEAVGPTRPRPGLKCVHFCTDRTKPVP
jgi:hypothetical protein